MGLARTSFLHGTVLSCPTGRPTVRERVPSPKPTCCPAVPTTSHEGRGHHLSGPSRGHPDSPWVTRGVSLSHAAAPVCREHHDPSGTLQEALSQLQSIGGYIRTQDQADHREAVGLALLERFDQLLFRGYLTVLGGYTITLCSLWVLWSRL